MNVAGVLRQCPATSVVAAATVAVGVPALMLPGMVRVLEQDPGAVGRGQWWRIVTPMFVQGYGLGQCLFNLLGIVLVGSAVERMLGRIRWVAVYFAGGILAIVLTSWLFPHATDSGASAGVAALIGAVGVGMLRPVPVHLWPPVPAQLYGVFFAVYLSALALGGPAAGAVAGSLVILGFVLTPALAGRSALHTGSIAVVFAATAALLVVGDAHGIGLAVGMLAAALLASTQPASGIMARGSRRAAAARRKQQ